MQIAGLNVPEEGRHWIYAVLRKAAKASFSVHAADLFPDIFCSECRCPIPDGHYLFEAYNLTVCFECIADAGTLTPGPAPGCLAPFWDRGEN